MATIRIGVLGGTFDPIHIGHLVLGAVARDALGLYEVVFVVANDPWMKVKRPIANAERRFEMTEAALVGAERLRASRLEIDRGGKSYTVDTLRSLSHVHRGASFVLIVGADAAAQIPQWHDAETLANLADVAIATRPNTSVALLPKPFRSFFLPMPSLELSSSDLRERIANGQSIDYLVPAATREVIDRYNLYRSRT